MLATTRRFFALPASVRYRNLSGSFGADGEFTHASDLSAFFAISLAPPHTFLAVLPLPLNLRGLLHKRLFCDPYLLPRDLDPRIVSGDSLAPIIVRFARGLRLGRYSRDIAIKSLFQFSNAVLSHVLISASARVDACAINAYRPYFKHAQFGCYHEQQSEGVSNGRCILFAKCIYRIVIRKGNSADITNRHEMPGYRLDPPRRHNPVRIAVQQRRRHHLRWVRRVTETTVIHFQLRQAHRFHAVANENRPVGNQKIIELTRKCRRHITFKIDEWSIHADTSTASSELRKISAAAYDKFWSGGSHRSLSICASCLSMFIHETSPPKLCKVDLDYSADDYEEIAEIASRNSLSFTGALPPRCIHLGVSM